MKTTESGMQIRPEQEATRPDTPQAEASYDNGRCLTVNLCDHAHRGKRADYLALAGPGCRTENSRNPPVRLLRGYSLLWSGLRPAQLASGQTRSLPPQPQLRHWRFWDTLWLHGGRNP